MGANTTMSPQNLKLCFSFNHFNFFLLPDIQTANAVTFLWRTRDFKNCYQIQNTRNLRLVTVILLLSLRSIDLPIFFLLQISTKYQSLSQNITDNFEEFRAHLTRIVVTWKEEIVGLAIVPRVSGCVKFFLPYYQRSHEFTGLNQIPL